MVRRSFQNSIDFGKATAFKLYGVSYQGTFIWIEFFS
jgi:hypothetical protein